MRFKQMVNILSAYATGNFNSRLKISDRYDDLDAIAESINMVGQELKAVTISRNYFNNIFHSVSDMIFVLDRSGKILDTNSRVYNHLGYSKESLLTKTLDDLTGSPKPSLTKDIAKQLKQPGDKTLKDYYFKTTGGKTLPIQLSASYLLDGQGKKNGILVIVKDRTAQMESENRVIRAIIDTQEEERKRLAKDLHDSLGQELVGVKFAISSMSENCEDAREKLFLQRSDHALAQIIADMRDICFNLLPKALEDFGLLKAVRELCLHTRMTHKVELKITSDLSFPDLPQQITVDLYRVIQEFINNAIRHGKTTWIGIDFKSTADRIYISLEDKGKGFSPGKVTKGMGLQNIESRIKSHKGEIAVHSAYGKGTNFQITLPLTY